MPIPVSIAKNMGADIVIAVNLYNNIFPFKMEYLKKPRLNLLAISRIGYQMVLYNLALENIKKADFVINPKIWEGNFNIFKNLIGNTTTIEDGRKATREIIPQIKRLL